VRNLEIKCYYPDLKQAERIALDGVRANYAGCLKQTDVYFNIDHGRLKLRHNRRATDQKPGAFISRCELIFYQRPDKTSARTSVYEILPIANGPLAELFFTRVWGVKARVRKSRKIFLRENLRIHLDSLRGLGDFLEIELIESRTFPTWHCRKRMRELVRRFNIQPSQILAGSYSDMLLP
jgi:adenylate cyclase class IV